MSQLQGHCNLGLTCLLVLYRPHGIRAEQLARETCSGLAFLDLAEIQLSRVQ